MKELSRRSFLRASSSLAVGAALLTETSCSSSSNSYTSRWQDAPDRIWIGPEFWANPLQDWHVAGGRVECIYAGLDRHLHLLTRTAKTGGGNLSLRVRAGRVGDSFGQGPGSVGFRVGNRGPLPGYRNALIFGSGLDAGIRSDGQLFLGDQSAPLSSESLDRTALELRLNASASSETATATLTVFDAESEEQLGEIAAQDLPADILAGGIALVANVLPPGLDPGNLRDESPAAGRFWFEDWEVSGDLVETHDDRTFGPILFTQYTLSRNVMKVTAQMAPVATGSDASKVRLEIEQDGSWRQVGEEAIDPSARTATFRVEPWDGTRDTRYRVLYALEGRDGTSEHSWEGTVRRDPVDQPEISVADISCNAHYAFPNTACVESMRKVNPDVLAFTGDQYYESTGRYGALVGQRGDRAIVDMLRKWYMHGWTWRELMRDRPTISIPDDHDVYHGNLWGEGCPPVAEGQNPDTGGYTMAPDFVNAVHRTQTAHHPDVFDPAPCQQGISVYFGDMVYGRVSFAIIADRQFKTAPGGTAPPTGGRADHVTDPKFNPKSADLPGLELLGERQLAFIRHWASDWSGADMKAVVSQTIFTAMATTHGPERQRLVADYDSNEWPQTARNRALREIRKAFAFHLAGDQHLPAVIRYGVEQHGDAAAAFASPAVNNLYPRWFEPETPGAHRGENDPAYLGEFSGSFGAPLTVLAVANPKIEFRNGVLEKEMDKSAGFGVVRFDKSERTVTVDCWPLLADPQTPGTQFPGWPVTVSQLDNYGAKTEALLPKLRVTGAEKPVVQVIREPSGEIVYTFRTPAADWQPPVFARARYKVRVSDPETGRAAEFEGVEATPDNDAVLDVDLG